MASKKPIFDHEEFIDTQVQVLEVFEEKINKLFVENVGNEKKVTREIVFEFLGLLRQTLSWYIKINKAMVRQNRLRIPKQKKSLN